MDPLAFLRTPELHLYDFHMPWSMGIIVIGFVLAWLCSSILERIGVTRYVWHLPLFFTALVVAFSSLVGILLAP